MKIVNERDPKFTPFQDMLNGAIFLDEDKDVMMKIWDEHEAKAISLKTGRIYRLYDEFEGVVVEATLTIK
jgi:hypothetical protein